MSAEGRGSPLGSANRYSLLCAALGFALGWAPGWFHGPIPEKFDVFYLDGAIAVWAFTSARLTIGLWVGVSTWPEPWWLRGPLVGLLVMLPPSLVALSNPECGPP